jgi:hypothetical protein
MAENYISVRVSEKPRLRRTQFGRSITAAVSSRELDDQAGSVGTSGCSGGVSNGTHQAGVGSDVLFEHDLLENRVPLFRMRTYKGQERMLQATELAFLQIDSRGSTHHTVSRQASVRSRADPGVAKTII